MSLPQNFHGDSLWDVALDQRVGVSHLVQSYKLAGVPEQLCSLSLCLSCKHALAVHKLLCVARINL